MQFIIVRTFPPSLRKISARTGAKYDAKTPKLTVNKYVPVRARAIAPFVTLLAFANVILGLEGKNPTLWKYAHCARELYCAILYPAVTYGNKIGSGPVGPVAPGSP